MPEVLQECRGTATMTETLSTTAPQAELIGECMKVLSWLGYFCTGIGSVVHHMGAALALAIDTNRTLVVAPITPWGPYLYTALTDRFMCLYLLFLIS